MEKAKETRPEAKHPTKADALWRELSVNDIENLVRVADTVHPDLLKSNRVFEERVRLFPEGCLALVRDDELCGYIISHPIRHRQPPALNSLLGEIAPDADQYYVHDTALLPGIRGGGYALEGINKVFSIAERFPTSCLVSVYNTASFWNRFGFEKPEIIDEVLRKKLLSYGDDATYLERKNEKHQGLV